jgi:hypothetical protein
LGLKKRSFQANLLEAIAFHTIPLRTHFCPIEPSLLHFHSVKLPNDTRDIFSNTFIVIFARRELIFLTDLTILFIKQLFKKKSN